MCVCLCVCLRAGVHVHHNDCVCVLQVAKRFGIAILEPHSIEQPTAVDRFQMDDGTEQFQLVLADGSRSQVLELSQLDDFAKCLADRPPARPVKGPKRKHSKRGSGSQRTATRQKTQHRQQQKQSRDGAKCGKRNLQRQTTLRSFDAADYATQLHNSVDIDFARALHDDSSNVDSFPALPSDKRMRDSLQAYRQMVSAPVVSQCVCAGCAERDFVSQMTTYHIGERKSDPKMLPLALLECMQRKLVHNPIMPSHMPTLTGGTCHLHGCVTSASPFSILCGTQRRCQTQPFVRICSLLHTDGIQSLILYKSSSAPLKFSKAPRSAATIALHG